MNETMLVGRIKRLTDTLENTVKALYLARSYEFGGAREVAEAAAKELADARLLLANLHPEKGVEK